VLPSAPRPPYLAHMGRELWLAELAGGRVVYVGYNSAQPSTFGIARRIARLACQPAVRRIVVDVRLNGGGNNATYGPLLQTLGSPAVNRRGRLYLLIGRATFSAAGNFAAEVERDTQAMFVGEPTGGGVNQYGDATPFALRSLGWTVYVATSYVVRGTEKDRRLAVEPDIRVDVTSADFLAARDPVLEGVLRRS